MAANPSPFPRKRRAYDHRLCEHVVRSGVRSLGGHVGIPRSTVSTWQRRGLRPVVTIEPFDQDQQHLLESITKLDRERGWRRPRRRLHPPKPTLGVRATQPNEAWHVDTTIVGLLDGTRAYLHAVIDNFSRKILAWTVAARLEPASTFEIAFSNSMIEAFWRSLKHQWLYLNSLDAIERLRTLVEFHVEQHNTQMPHAAFSGQTPDEMYFGLDGRCAPRSNDHMSDPPRRRQASRVCRLAVAVRGLGYRKRERRRR